MTTPSALATAAVLLLAIGVVHSWLGERRLIGPLLAPDRRSGMLANSDRARKVLRFAWHLTTLTWWSLAAILLALAATPLTRQGMTILLIIATLSALSGLTILIVGRGRHLAWPVFLAVAGLTLWPLI
jgi:hypothetical protein